MVIFYWITVFIRNESFKTVLPGQVLSERQNKKENTEVDDSSQNSEFTEDDQC
jgi:hypothetical protein